MVIFQQLVAYLVKEIERANDLEVTMGNTA